MYISVPIFLGMFVTLVFFITYNYKSMIFSIKKTILFGIFSFILCSLIILIANVNYSLFALFGSILLSTVINCLMVKDVINIKKIPKFIFVFVFVFFILTSLIQSMSISLLGWGDINSTSLTLTPYQELIITFLSDLIILIILGITYFKDLKKDFIDFKKRTMEILDTGFKWWLIGLLIMVVSNVIIGLFIPKAEAGNEEAVQTIIKSSKILSVIAVGIIAPFVEELVFRKSFRELIKNDVLFIIISGLVFASLHVVLSLNSLWDLFYIIPYLGLGCSFAYAYTKTNNIYTTIIVHMFHNTVITLLSVGIGAVILL